MAKANEILLYQYSKYSMELIRDKELIYFKNIYNKSSRKNALLEIYLQNTLWSQIYVLYTKTNTRTIVL